MKYTLLSHDIPNIEITSLVKQSLHFLECQEFISLKRINKENHLLSEIKSTLFGDAIFYSGLSPEEGILVMKDLLQSQKQLYLKDSLHLLYLITPISPMIVPKWDYYNELYSKLSESAKTVGSRIGIDEGYLYSLAFSPPSGNHIYSIIKPGQVVNDNDFKILVYIYYNIYLLFFV